MLAPSLARANSLLMLHPDAPLRAGTVARLAGEASRTVALSALRSLVRMGIARRSIVLGSEVFEANRRSHYYRAAYHAALVDLPIDDALAGANVVAVFLFGSVVRGAATHDSDIDLLIVGSTPDERLTQRRLSAIGDRYGRRIDAVFVSTADLQQALDAADPFLTGAVRDGLLIRGDWS